jgi:hypothetical protein
MAARGARLGSARGRRLTEGSRAQCQCSMGGPCSCAPGTCKCCKCKSGGVCQCKPGTCKCGTAAASCSTPKDDSCCAKPAPARAVDNVPLLLMVLGAGLLLGYALGSRK